MVAYGSFQLLSWVKKLGYKQIKVTKVSQHLNVSPALSPCAFALFSHHARQKRGALNDAPAKMRKSFGIGAADGHPPPPPRKRSIFRFWS